MNWTTDLPTEPGLYLWRRRGESNPDKWRFGTVRYGFGTPGSGPLWFKTRYMNSCTVESHVCAGGEWCSIPRPID
jgi:hypothetical protein